MPTTAAPTGGRPRLNRLFGRHCRRYAVFPRRLLISIAWFSFLLCAYPSVQSTAFRHPDQGKTRRTRAHPTTPPVSEGSPTAQSPLVRVCLLRFEGAKQIVVNATPGARLLGAQGSERAAGTGPWTITATGNGVQVSDANGRRLGTLATGQYWRIQTDEAGTQLGIRGSGSAIRRYRGSLEIRQAGNGGPLRLINEVGIEPYLGGVVISEIGDGPLEALKAQTIAARTYAISSRGRWKADGYDLRDTVDSQAYNGVEAETPDGNRAVLETSGWILTQNGQAIDADFCDDCGGVTAPGDDPNVLPRSVSDAEAHRNIRHAPYGVWTLNLSSDRLTTLLGRSGKARGQGVLQNVEIAARDVSGRAQRVRLTWGPKREAGSSGFAPAADVNAPHSAPLGKNKNSVLLSSGFGQAALSSESSANTTEISGENLRALIGYNVLRSTLFVIRRAPNGDFQFDGKGWGHGHGLCQQGALALAAPPLHRACAQILQHYYPGAQLTRMPQAEAEGVREEEKKKRGEQGKSVGALLAAPNTGLAAPDPQSSIHNPQSSILNREGQHGG